MERRLSRAAEVFRVWRRRPVAERARLVGRAAEVLEAGKERYGRLMTLEMGKTLKVGGGRGGEDAPGAAATTPSRPERFLADEPVELGAHRAYRRFLPLGPVLTVMPWNFPFWQVLRVAAPAAGGRERGAAQARLLRAPVRPGHRGGLPAGRLPRGRLPGAAGRRPPGGAAGGGRAGGGGLPHRQRGGRDGGGRGGRPGPQEDGAGAGRERRLRGDALGRRRAGRPHRGDGPHHQHRPVLHRRQAVRGPPGGARALRGRPGGRDAGAAGRRSARPGHRPRAALLGRGAGQAGRPGGAAGPRRGAAALRRRGAGRPRRLLPADRADRTCPAARPPTGRSCSGRWRWCWR